MCAGVTRPRGMGRAEAEAAATAAARARGGGTTRTLKPDHHEHQAGHLQVSARRHGGRERQATSLPLCCPQPRPGRPVHRSPTAKETEAGADS